MDFTLTQEQRMTVEVVEALLADAHGARDGDRWRRLADLALLGALVPERAGGLGLSECDLVPVAEACGRARLPEPMIEQAGIAAPMLAELADDPAARAWLARAMTGEARIAVGHPINPFVADAETADVLLLACQDEVHLVERAAVTLQPQPSIDPSRRLFRVNWTPDDATRKAGAGAGAAVWDRALDRGALFAAAHCLGLADGAIRLAVAYASERVQFGRPIGAFQAVKHQLATAQVRLEFARPVVQAAAAQIGHADIFSRARVSHAKLQATEAARLATRTAVQVHGAMGISWEVEVHFFLKTALALSGAWGDLTFHRRRIARRLFEAGLGPEFTFAREEAAHG